MADPMDDPANRAAMYVNEAANRVDAAFEALEQAGLAGASVDAELSDLAALAVGIFQRLER